MIVIGPSQPPFNLSLVVLSPSVVDLTWLPPAFKDRNGIIRQYWIQISEKNNSEAPFTSFRELQEESPPVIMENLHPSYQYQLRVSAVTVDRGPSSEYIAWTMPEDGMYVLCVFIEFAAYL